MLVLGLLILLSVFFVSNRTLAQVAEDNLYSKGFSIESFPIMAAFKIYSVQGIYELTETDHLIFGLAYVNSKVNDLDGIEVGQFFAPTIPVGYRRYIVGNFHIEYQLWPAYNFFLDTQENKFYNGFDLYSELRAGYRFDLKLGKTPMFLNLQYVFGIGLYPGNKSERFLEVAKESPPFHFPSLSVGVHF